MPLLSEDEPEPKNRRRRRWALALLLGVAFLLPGGVITWSWFSPIPFECGKVSGSLGRTDEWGTTPSEYGSDSLRDRHIIVRLPAALGGGHYMLEWMSTR